VAADVDEAAVDLRSVGVHRTTVYDYLRKES
jgi:hypothetical protein